MNKDKILNLINGFHGDYNELYDKSIILENEKSDFNYLYYNEIVYMSLFLYHLRYGVENLSKNGVIPKLFGKVKSYEEFKSLLNKYKDIPFHHELLPDEKNIFQEIWRLAEAKLLSRDSWTKIYSSSINKKEVNDIGKLYISVDNGSLYQFACLLMTKSLKSGIKDYEFKVNNDPSINRRDNVVIYFTQQNLNAYLTVIDTILKENPSLKINDSHLFGYSLKNGVCIAKDYQDGSSFTEKVCNTILKMKDSGYSDNQIADLLELSVEQRMSDILSYIEDEPGMKM